MKRWKKVLILCLVILAIAAVAGYFLLSGDSQVTVASLNIDQAQVKRGNIQVMVHGTGALEVATTRDVYSRAGGRVAEVYVEDGDNVEAGELIALLENDTLKNQLESQSDEFYLKELEISATRGQKADTTIRSPMAGRVKELNAGEGDDMTTVQRQYGSLLVLSTDGRMKVQVELDEETLRTGRFEIPMDVKVRIGSQTETGSALSLEGNLLTVQIPNDTYDVGERAVVTEEGGRHLGEGPLEINKPVQVTGVSGQIQTVHVEENDKVRVNARLFTLEDDAVSLATESAIMERDALERNLDDTRKQLEWMEIRAPISGVIGNITLKEDATIQEGTLVGTIIQTDRAKLRLAVDELDVAAVLPGQKAQIKIDAIPGKVYEAQVERVLPLGNRESGVTTYDVLLYMDARDNMLPLMSISGDIVVASAEDVLLVPVSALITSGEGVYDVMMAPTEADLAGYNEAMRRPSNRFSSMMGGQNDAATLQSIAPQLMRRVELGLISGEYAQVVSGLNEGEQVVLPRNGSNIFASMMRMGGR